jgi:hypothetical protein
MPLVLFEIAFDPRNPRVLPSDVRAVPAEPYAGIEDDAGNVGGVTRSDIRAVDVRCLGKFANGSEVHGEGDPEDVLHGEADATTPATCVGWRATIGGVGS